MPLVTDSPVLTPAPAESGLRSVASPSAIPEGLNSISMPKVTPTPVATTAIKTSAQLAEEVRAQEQKNQLQMADQQTKETTTEQAPWYKRAWNRVASGASVVANGLYDAGAALVGTVAGAAKGVYEFVRPAVEAVASAFGNAVSWVGTNIVKPILSPFISAGKALYDTILKPAGEAVASAVKSAFSSTPQQSYSQTQSEQKITEGVFGIATGGIVSGIRQAERELARRDEQIAREADARLAEKKALPRINDYMNHAVIAQLINDPTATANDVRLAMRAVNFREGGSPNKIVTS